MFTTTKQLKDMQDEINSLKDNLGEEKLYSSDSLYAAYAPWCSHESKYLESTGVYKKIDDVDAKLDEVIKYLGIKFKESKKTKAEFIKIKK